jgi:hemerythrin-like domain-containing protein
MRCTDLLIQDHKIILRALQVLEQMAQMVEKHEAVEQEDVEAILRFLHLFADEHHQAKEESTLFPELLRTSTAQHRPLQQMRFEHEQERSLVRALEDALYTKKGVDFVRFADRFVSLIRTHIYKEDNILFDLVEHWLSPEQDAKVVEEFDKFKINPEFQTELRRLEWKYLRKAA